MAGSGVAARMVSIAEPGPSSTAVRRATSAATSLMRSRSSAFSTRSEAQVEFGLALHRGQLALQLGAVLARAVELAFGQHLFAAQRLGRGVVAPLDGRELLAQIGLDAARRVKIGAQLVALALAVGEHARLLGKAQLEVGHAAAHDLGFGRLRRELAFQIADAQARAC